MANLDKVQKQQKSQKPWGLLGEIEFELIDAPLSFRFTEAAEFAEHAKIGRKPGLQYTGEALHQLDLRFRFHCGWCNPDKQLRELQKARRKHEPLKLVLGNGHFNTSYVIEEIRTDLERTDLEGKTIEIDVDVRLKETTTKPKPKKLKRSPFVKKKVRS